MDCPNCNKQSRCGCKSCKSRVKFPSKRACKLKNLPENKSICILKCPYCRKGYSVDYLLDLEWNKRKKVK